MIERLAQYRTTDLGGRQPAHVIAFAALQETVHVALIRLDAPRRQAAFLLEVGDIAGPDRCD